MKTRMVVILFFTSVELFRALGVNLSGVVKNSAGVSVDGVTVRLGKLNIATTTDPSGSFCLIDNTTGVQPATGSPGLPDDCPVHLAGNRLFFNSRVPADIRVGIYGCDGKLLFSHSEPASLKKKSIPLPCQGRAVHVLRVFLDDQQHTFVLAAGLTAPRRVAASLKGLATVKQTGAAEPMDDALLFTKEGYSLYRLPVTKPDMSDLQISMTPMETGTVTDSDGNDYRTVRIGNQVWTTENLRTTKYNDGTTIQLVTADASWGSFNTAGYCFYNNSTDPAAQKKWGALYNWNAVKTGRLAPKGWHVSTDADWDTLQSYLMANGYNFDGTLSVLNRDSSETDDNKIAKSIATTTDWPVDSTGSGSIGNDVIYNNASGFSALPGGYRHYDGAFFYQGDFCFFWTSSEHDASFAWYRSLWDVTTDLNRGDRVKLIGCSVRLVRDK